MNNWELAWRECISINKQRRGLRELKKIWAISLFAVSINWKFQMHIGHLISYLLMMKRQLQYPYIFYWWGTGTIGDQWTNKWTCFTNDEFGNIDGGPVFKPNEKIILGKDAEVTMVKT